MFSQYDVVRQTRVVVKVILTVVDFDHESRHINCYNMDTNMFIAGTYCDIYIVLIFSHVADTLSDTLHVFKSAWSRQIYFINHLTRFAYMYPFVKFCHVL